jgi:esterase/lipase superfamily enzyme
MIFIVSNRNYTNFNDERLFGDNFNQDDRDGLRIAKAEHESESWHLTLLDEHPNDVDPTSVIFEEVSNDNKPCVIFIHVFNQDLKKNLNKCKEIEAYGVNVIAFSWPSNPGPQFILRKIKEYKRARKHAGRSVFALTRFFDKLQEFIELQGSPRQIKTVLIHSMGNFLTQSFVVDPNFDHQLKYFKNIILHQADVDSAGHHEWVDILAQNTRVIATINETDDTLDISDILNPDRLGNTADNLHSNLIKYYDFTKAGGADDSHRLWNKPAVINNNIQKFFQSAFHGKKINAIDGSFNTRTNAFEVR